MENQNTNNRKNEFIVTSIALYLCYVSYGMAYNIWGPTWVDLVDLLGSTQDQMAYANSLMAIGYTVGAFTGGFLFNCLNRQILVSIYLILMGVSTTLTPILKSYPIFLVLSAIFGFGEGGFDTGCNAWILEMWREENGPYMQAMYFTFGLGSLLAPLISLKFLDENKDFNDFVTNDTLIYSEKHSLMNMTLNSPQFGAHHHNFIFSTKLLTPLTKRFNGSLNMSSNDNTTSGINSSDIYIPYSITGSLCFISALIVIVMYFIKKYEPISENSVNENQNSRKSSEVNEESEESTINNNLDSKCLIESEDKKKPTKKFVYSMVFVGAIMFCLYEGMENINFEYLQTFFLNTKLNLSEDTSDLIVSAISASYTIGRGVGIFLAIKVEPKYLLYCNFVLISIANIILYIFSNTSEMMVIIGTVILGLGFSTVFPSIYSYLERHIHLTNVMCGILMVSCASVATVDPIIVGRYIKDYPYILLYVNIASIVLVVIAFMSIEVTTSLRTKYLKLRRKTNQDYD